MSHIFISYAWIDGHDYAEKLERDLQASGYSTWRDTRNIHPDQDFTAEIEKAIEPASHVVVCMTPDIKHDNSSCGAKFSMPCCSKSRSSHSASPTLCRRSISLI